MNIEELSGICTDLSSVTNDIKWGNDLCFNIGDKMFFVMSLDSSPTSASFKVSNENFEALICQEGFKPAPYLGRYKWVHIDDLSRLSKEQWKKYIRQSYILITSKFSNKLKLELKIED